jgi:hypothetical protein
MGGADGLGAGARGEQADEAHVADPRFLQPVDRGDGGMAGGEHRVDDDDQPLRAIVGSLEIIFDAVERDRLAVEAYVRDPRRGDEVEHSLGHGEAGAHDRRDHQFLAGDRRRARGRHRGLDRDEVGGKLASDLVAEQGRGLPNHRAEQLDRAVPVAQQSELVLHQGVRDDRQSVHFIFPKRPCRR